jgi:hypothetical protein
VADHPGVWRTVPRRGRTSLIPRISAKSTEQDPTGSLAAELANHEGLVQGMLKQIEEAREQLGRLERFASVLKVKI